LPFDRGGISERVDCAFGSAWFWYRSRAGQG